MLSRFFDRLKEGLTKTREALAGRIAAVVSGAGRLDEETLEQLEAILIQADVGVETASRLMEALRQRARQEQFQGSSSQVLALLREEVVRLLGAADQGLPFASLPARPYAILVVGVNGVGKTTTIGKLAKRYTDEGHKVMVAACDTFRAAAVPQLEIWAGRAGVDIVRAQQGADPAAVAFDALAAARARRADVLIVDTAGRLHTKVNLMEELKKIRRSLAKQDPRAPHETLLVLDATVGRNALAQEQIFGRTAYVSGLVMTKLDGTARGGVLVPVAQASDAPIKLIGVGEGVEDLQPFDARAFSRLLVGLED